ncbi:MAG TPA: N-formylglutamate amidohydrolase [Aeromicrobium sp.]|nr:N-formylglutamate amidohydrolase [Aeromicrobium sp.]
MSASRGAPVDRGSLRGPYEFAGDPTSRVLAIALHAGHDVRPEVESRMTLDEAARLREEDPFTDQIAETAASRVVVFRSRFEVDLNRKREHAVYRTPEDCWGLDVWGDGVPSALVGRSLAIHDDFYADLGRHLDDVAMRGPFVVFDVHSYNHRREPKVAPPSPQGGHPDLNVGTRWVKPQWRPVLEAVETEFRKAEIAGRRLDVRENVVFRGGYLPRWIAERYPGTGCAIALEFKKTFMDEWTGTVDLEHLQALADALHAAQTSVVRTLVRAA